jgi:4-hydroxybenzoate polyprenyltransferase
VSAPRRALVKAESAWWMSRVLLSNLGGWTATMGWVAANPDAHSLPRLVALYIAITLAGGAVFVVNDILDAEGDAVTAPYLPIPAGLVTVREARALLGAFLVGASLALYLAGGGLARFAVAAGLIIGGFVLVLLYSKVKSEGLLASVVVTIPQTVVPAAVGWVVADGGARWRLIALLVYCVLAGVSNNVLAALRDVDRDGAVGNRTLPVRKGAPAAFRFAALLGVLALIPVALLAVDGERGQWAWPFVGAAVAVIAFCYRPLLRKFAEPERGRTQRLKDLQVYKFAEYLRHTAAVAAFNPVIAVVVGVLFYTGLHGGYVLYRRRLVSGALRRSWDRAEGGAATTGPGSPTKVSRG